MRAITYAQFATSVGWSKTVDPFFLPKGMTVNSALTPGELTYLEAMAGLGAGGEGPGTIAGGEQIAKVAASDMSTFTSPSPGGAAPNVDPAPTPVSEFVVTAQANPTGFLFTLPQQESIFEGTTTALGTVAGAVVAGAIDGAELGFTLGPQGALVGAAIGGVFGLAAGFLVQNASDRGSHHVGNKGVGPDLLAQHMASLSAGEGSTSAAAAPHWQHTTALVAVQ